MIAAIPYRTFPAIDLGPVELRTFGVMVAFGVLTGAWLAGRWMERFGVPSQESHSLAFRMVLAGVVGSRVTWVLTNLDQVDSAVDVVAVWEGGLQFSGGFVTAVLVAVPTFRRLGPARALPRLDGYALGLTLGLAIGRIGCFSVGEHLGTFSSFAFAVRYDGGRLVETHIGDVPIERGMTFHNTSLYELLLLLVLFGVLIGLRRAAEARPGVLISVFCIGYAAQRFTTDFVRANDRLVLGLTGAQYAMVATAAAGAWLLVRRPAPDAA